LKRRYKIAILASAGFAAWAGLTGPGMCIFVDGPQPSWLGSDNGCGPVVTYEFQKHFGILWHETGGGSVWDMVKHLKGSAMGVEY